MSRTWFSRLWVLQEVVLSRNSEVLCGVDSLDFSILLAFGSMLTLGNAGMAFLRHFGDDTAWEEKESTMQGLLGHISNSVTSLRQVAHIQFSIQNGEKPDIVQVLSQAMQAESTDDRDRIYGILGYNDDLIIESGSIGKAGIVVDYALSVEEIYTAATFAIASRRKTLEFLALISDCGHKKYPRLPSWCPDYSRPPPSLNRGGNLSSGFHTGCLWNSRPELNIELSHNGATLIVDGFFYDTLYQCTETRHRVDQEHSLLALLFEIMTLAASLHGRRPNRVESLWRLLFADNYRTGPPASAAAGLLFPLFIFEVLATINNAKSASQRAEPREQVRWLARITDTVRELRRLEPENADLLPDPTELRQLEETCRTMPAAMHRVVLGFQEKHLRTASLRSRAVRVGLEMEFAAIVDWETWPEDEQPINTEMAMGVIASLTGYVAKLAMDYRYFSTTKSQLLGAGNMATGRDCEVWFLHGCSAPVLLRQRGEGRYEFCSPAYIQGLMLGEPFEDPEPWMRSVRRIEIE